MRKDNKPELSLDESELNLEKSVKSYFPNGALSQEIFYRDGKKMLARVYYNNGSLILEVNYKNGHECGIELHYRRNKTIERIVTWPEVKMVTLPIEFSIIKLENHFLKNSTIKESYFQRITGHIISLFLRGRLMKYWNPKKQPLSDIIKVK